MRINDKNFPLFPILLVFVLIYLFFAAKPLGKKLNIKPEWTVFVDKKAITDSYSGKRLFPFRLGSKMGYYGDDGTIASLILFENKASISADFWAEYAQNADRVAFFTRENKQSGTFDRAGFPFFNGNGIFLFHPGGSSFSKHNALGDTEWVYEGYVPITAFSASPAGCAAGFADGNVVCLDKTGKTAANFYPGGSNVQVIFGTALSRSGTYSACLSGLNPQRIVVAELDAGKARIVYHDYLPDSLREQTLVQFSSDDKYAFFNSKSGLISVLLSQKTAFFVPFSGKILSISELGSNDLFFILSKQADIYTLTVLCEGRQNKGSFSFEASNAFLHSENGNVYIGRDERISKMLVSFD